MSNTKRKRIKLFIKVFICFSLSMYLTGAFKHWDIWWVSDIDQWTGGDRLGFFMMHVIYPTVLGIGAAFMFINKKEQIK